MAKFSRRKFLEAGAVSSVTMIGSTTAALPILQQELSAQAPARAHAPVAAPLEAQQRDLLRAAMDEIIPAGDGMPAASEVGGVEYLEQLAQRHARSAKELHEALGALEKSTQGRTKASFVSLARAQRVEQLTAFEKQEAATFQTLRNYVYEAYYTRPEIWKLVGYEFYPSDGPGPVTKKVFHESALEVIRQKTKGYVEVT
jgi:gluconate 2-dehydrogenase subunit 3-like protein